MNQPISNKEPLFSFHVWDRSVRIFHWLNVICIIGLISIGLIILNDKSFGFSADGKILLKTIHVYFGYIFVLNLVWRVIWGFLGNRYSRWKSILPFGKGYKDSLVSYIADMKENKPSSYTGHNPLARLMITCLFLLLTVQAVTGLVLAGTDLYFPPFGHEIAEWVKASGEDHSQLVDLKPGSKQGVDPQAYKEMRALRKPYITTHKYSFYILVLFIFVHIFAVVFTEVKEKNGLISAMFTGDKVFTKKPIDVSDDDKK